MTEERIRGMRLDAVYVDEIADLRSPWGTPLEPKRVTVVNGSPMLEMGGRPVAWFENWLADRWKNDWRTKVWERMR